MTIGITGATGHLGRLVSSRLKAEVAASTIVAIVRSPQKATDLGIAARKADYNDAAALNAALAGIETLLLISSSEVGQRERHHRHVIDAAKQNGVKWIVYTSLLRADTSPLSLAPEHAATEKMLRESGIPFTLLRNGWYTENYTGSIAGALQGGAFPGSASDGRISSAARADYAEAAVTVLTNDGHLGKTYELAGDDSYTLTEFAAEISKQTGRDIPYKNLPEPEYAALLEKFGLPEPLAQAIAGWDTAASHDALFDDTHQMSSLIGRPTTPMSTSVREALNATRDRGVA